LSIVEAIILGIVQGATEFLPISSSGHLVLIPASFRMTQPDLNAVAIAHLGTLLAVTVYFFKDLRDIARTQGVDEAKRRWIKSALFYYINRNEELRLELKEIIAGHCGDLWLDPKRGKYRDRDDVVLSVKIKIPTMIFVGEKDRFFIPLAKTLHEKIKGSEIDVVPGVGHMLNMEAPDRFNFRLEQFLERAAKR